MIGKLLICLMVVIAVATALPGTGEDCKADWAGQTQVSGVCQTNCAGSDIPVAIDTSTGSSPCVIYNVCCVKYNAFGY